MKKCTKCAVVKAFDEFAKNRRTKDGLRSECKVCSAAYKAANAEAISRKSAEWYASHAEEVREHQRAYYAANREAVRLRQAMYRAENAEAIKHYQAAYFASRLDSAKREAQRVKRPDVSMWMTYLTNVATRVLPTKQSPDTED